MRQRWWADRALTQLTSEEVKPVQLSATLKLLLRCFLWSGNLKQSCAASVCLKLPQLQRLSPTLPVDGHQGRRLCLQTGRCRSVLTGMNQRLFTFKRLEVVILPSGDVGLGVLVT